MLKPRFTLFAVFVLITIGGAGMGVFQHYFHLEAKSRQQLKSRGAAIVDDFDATGEPAVFVFFYEHQWTGTAVDFSRVQHIPHVRHVTIAGASLSNVDLSCLEQMSDLESVVLRDTREYAAIDRFKDARPDVEVWDCRRRERQLIFTSDDLKAILEEWEEVWEADQPDHMTPFRTHGGVI